MADICITIRINQITEEQNIFVFLSILCKNMCVCMLTRVYLQDFFVFFTYSELVWRGDQIEDDAFMCIRGRGTAAAPLPRNFRHTRTYPSTTLFHSVLANKCHVERINAIAKKRNDKAKKDQSGCDNLLQCLSKIGFIQGSRGQWSASLPRADERRPGRVMTNFRTLVLRFSARWSKTRRRAGGEKS